jgi:ribosomal protein S6E (S10)
MRLSIMLAVVALCATACGKSPGERLTEAAVSAATGQKVSVDHNGDKVTLTTDKGELKISGGDNATLPAGFPDDVYLPSGYKVESAMEMPDAMIVALQAPGQVAALSAAASRQMQARGWNQVMAMQPDGETRLLAFDKDKRNASLSFDHDGDRVRMSVQLSNKQ